MTGRGPNVASVSLEAASLKFYPAVAGWGSKLAVVSGVPRLAPKKKLLDAHLTMQGRKLCYHAEQREEKLPFGEAPDRSGLSQAGGKAQA